MAESNQHGNRRSSLRRRAPIGNISLVSPFARRRASARGPDPLRIRSLPQVSATLRAADFCRRAVSGRHIRLQEQANHEEPARVRSLRDGFGRAGFDGGAEVACRSVRGGRRGGVSSASHRGRGANRRADSRSHRAVALHVDARQRHSRRRSGDQWHADLRGDEGRSRA